MSTELITRPTTEPATPAVLPRGGGIAAGGLLFLLTVLVLLIGAVHLTQGTSGLGLGDLLAYVTGSADPDRATAMANVLAGSRVPRLVSGVLVGLVLGMAGVAMQSLARNPLASPDTLAVNAGAYLAVVAVAATGITLPALPNGAVAFAGGLAAATVVVVLGGTGSTARLVLAGSALTLALGAVTSALQLIKREETAGLFAWGGGSLLAVDLDAARQLLPVIVVAALLLLLLSRKLDLLALGDDVAVLLGVHVGRLRLTTLVFAVLLATTAVSLAGPIGFVGLFAPAVVRMLGRVVPAARRHRVLFPAAGLTGAAMVIGADVALRAILGDEAGAIVPTGVVTSVLGAVVLVVVARRVSATRAVSSAGVVATASPARFVVVLVAAIVLVVVGILAAMMIGGRWILWGDLVNWWSGRSGMGLSASIEDRIPRVLAAFLAGAALAAAGTVTQAVCRNPLAEPGLLGVTAGAGLGAVATITLVPAPSAWQLAGGAMMGAFTAFAVVYLLSRRGGLDSGRVVLIGFGVSAGAAAITAALLVIIDPWDQVKALTWLSGSTANRTLPQLIPVAVALVVVVPLMFAARRRLDLLALDDDTPRLLGVELERHRISHLAGAAVLTATAVCAVGVISFVGLVAPHCARALVGARNGRVLPVSILLGGLLVSVGDTLGRSIIAPAQLPAGLVAMVIGTPYFIYLLWRTRD